MNSHERSEKTLTAGDDVPSEGGFDLDSFFQRCKRKSAQAERELFQYHTRTICGRCGAVSLVFEGIFEEKGGVFRRVAEDNRNITTRRYREIHEMACQSCNPHMFLKATIRSLINEDKGAKDLPERLLAIINQYQLERNLP